MSLTSSDLELVNDAATGAGDQKIGVRFAGVNIPPGWAISNAVIQFTADETQSETTSLTIRAQATDNAPAFVTNANNISTRPVTASSVSWQPPAWNTLSEAGPAQQTPNLASALQEVINRPGWMEGNAVAFLITGTGHRTADSFDKAGGTPARLIVTFQRPAAVPPQFTGIHRATNGTVTLTWASQPGTPYTVQTSLGLTSWTNFATGVIAPGISTTFAIPAGSNPDPATEPTLFFRALRE
jgi:hypothetical protein